MNFDDKSLLQTIADASPEALDQAPFGVVTMDRDGNVTAYNRWESELSGLSPDRVIGRQFFTDVAPCTNNFMVAHRYSEDGPLDETIDYLFTYKLRPTPVRLRLLRGDGERQYLLVTHRS